MSGIFADTFYFLALMNPRDSHHVGVQERRSEFAQRLVTSQYVLTEVGDALASPQHRPRFLSLLKLLEADPDVEVVPGSDHLFRRGVELFGRRLDKSWSLTDCLSFVVMEDRGLTLALTGDHHFRQAGFVPLIED